MSAGYFAIGIYQPKTTENIGTLWRSAWNFGAAFCFTIGRRCKPQASDTTRTWQKIPLFEYPTFETFAESRPRDCALIGIEQSDASREISTFSHLPRSIYLLGSEDNGLPPRVQEACAKVIHVSTPMCLNVAVAGSIVMYDRSRAFPAHVSALDERMRRLEHKLRSVRAAAYRHNGASA